MGVAFALTCQMAGTTNKFLLYEVYRDDEALHFMLRLILRSGANSRNRGRPRAGSNKGKGIFYGSKIP